MGPGLQTTPSEKEFLELVRAIVSGDAEKAARLLDVSPTLVRHRAAVGATRKAARPYFFDAIKHYLYAGDTALHLAAAGFRSEIAEHLLDRGADHSAKNRRGAEPLHYASDANVWSP